MPLPPAASGAPRKSSGWVWIVGLAGLVIAGMLVTIWLQFRPEQNGDRAVSQKASPTTAKTSGASTMSRSAPSPFAETGKQPAVSPPHDVAKDPEAPKVESPAGPAPAATHVEPSFNCSKAATPIEQLICRDPRLAQLDLAMSTAYRGVLESLPPGKRRAFQMAHAKWFTHYSETCNASADDDQRSSCIVNFLTEHTRDLKKRIRP